MASAESDSIDLDALRAALVELTTAQRSAVESLATGATHAAAAEAADVTRETVTRWVGHHPAFRSALDTYRDALAIEQAQTVRAIRSRALRIVLAKLDEDADMSTALAVLRAVPEPTESTGGPLTALPAPTLLDMEQHRNRTLAAPPRPQIRGDGLADLLGMMDGSAEQAEYDRIEHLTLTRLADAAAIEPRLTRRGPRT